MEHQNLDFPVFRFVNFFELHQLLSEKLLRLTKLRRFSDPNEGFGQLLDVRRSLLTRHSYSTKDALRKLNNATLNSNYVSCWTQNPDSIALWSLYSPDYCSFRIRITASALDRAAQGYVSAHNWRQYRGPLPGTDYIPEYCALDNVEYVDFLAFNERINSAHTELEQRITEIPEADIPSHYQEIEKQTGFRKHWIFAKDAAYEFEREVRVAIIGGFRSKRTIEEWEDDPFKRLVWPSEEDIFPDSIYSEVEPDFVESVCLDPRCPPWKARVFREILSSFELDWESSRAFGHLLEHNDFSVPKW